MGAAGSENATRWRVFVSHTSELRDFPRGTSYLAEVERAIAAAGHVVVDMADFPAADRPVAEVCADRVRGCDVYLAVLGTRYGSPVRDRTDVSYTELEFDTATEAGLDRLVFMLDPDAPSVGIPPAKLIDREFGARQDEFRRRVRESGLTTQSFAEPAKLGQLVERSLRELADTRSRILSGIQREQVPAEPKPLQASKFINPPPATAPSWFQGRSAETRLLEKYVGDPGIRMMTVVGRGGVGKTVLVCRLLKGLEAGRVAGIVYLSHNGKHTVDYPTLVTDLLRLVPPDTAEPLHRLYQNPRHSPREMMLAVLDAFRAGEPVVVLLDNLESVMDTEREALAEQALDEALSAVLTAPAHAVTVIATTRVAPNALLKVEPARQRQMRLDEGLGSPDAETVLRELDDDGHLGLRDAPDEVLDALRLRTRGFPRALEAVKAILDGDRTLTPQDLLDRTRDLPEDQVVQVLVADAYDLLDSTAQQVMQALSVYAEPVPAVAIDYLLRRIKPTTDAVPILTRLVRRQMVHFHAAHYSLHPLDRDYARSQLPTGRPGESPAAFALARLQARAADYYARIRTPRESWRGLEDVRPQLAEFGLRCDTGDFDTAATVLAAIEFDYLQMWGHYRTLVDLHRRIHGRITEPSLNTVHLRLCAISHARLGEFQQAIDLLVQSLRISRDIGDPDGESVCHGSLGICYMSLGDYQRAIEFHTQCLTIARDTGDRRSEGVSLSNLALCHMGLGGHGLAIEVLTDALAIARETGNRRAEGSQLDNLGLWHHSRGDFRQAVDTLIEALAIVREIGYRYAEAYSLIHLGRARRALGEPQQAMTLLEEAVRIGSASGQVAPTVEALSGLARVQLQLNDPAAALATTRSARGLLNPVEEPMVSLLTGLALLDLRRVEEAAKAFNDALTEAGALLVLADRNLAAIRVQALALGGLAVATGDPNCATEAVRAFARANAINIAAGDIAEAQFLLDVISAHDAAGILAGVRAGAGP